MYKYLKTFKCSTSWNVKLRQISWQRDVGWMVFGWKDLAVHWDMNEEMQQLHKMLNTWKCFNTFKCKAVIFNIYTHIHRRLQSVQHFYECFETFLTGWTLEIFQTFEHFEVFKYIFKCWTGSKCKFLFFCLIILPLDGGGGGESCPSHADSSAVSLSQMAFLAMSVSIFRYHS